MQKPEEGFYNSALFQIKELRLEKPDHKDILDFYEEILKVQHRVYSLFQPDFSGYDKNTCSKKNSQGIPILKADDVRIDEELFDKLFDDICNLVIKKRANAKTAGLGSKFLAGKHEMLLKGLLENSLAVEQLAKDLKVDYALFCFITNLAVIPFMENYSEKIIGEIDQNKWLKGYCPVCGSEPMIARLESDIGKRWLFCPRCRCEWLFKRVICPFCENEDQDTLRYFFSEDNNNYRIEVCDKCKRYIKTVDSRLRGNVFNLFVEDIATLAFDVVAMDEGFNGNADFKGL